MGGAAACVCEEGRGWGVGEKGGCPAVSHLPPVRPVSIKRTAFSAFFLAISTAFRRRLYSLRVCVWGGGGGGGRERDKEERKKNETAAAGARLAGATRAGAAAGAPIASTAMQSDACAAPAGRTRVIWGAVGCDAPRFRNDTPPLSLTFCSFFGPSRPRGRPTTCRAACSRHQPWCGRGREGGERAEKRDRGVAKHSRFKNCGPHQPSFFLRIDSAIRCVRLACPSIQTSARCLLFSACCSQNQYTASNAAPPRGGRCSAVRGAAGHGLGRGGSRPVSVGVC